MEQVAWQPLAAHDLESKRYDSFDGDYDRLPDCDILRALTEGFIMEYKRQTQKVRM